MATREDLRVLQAQSLDDKVQRTLGLISEWYAHWENQCYVLFSGGKDSTVLSDITAKWCAIAGIPLELVFVDTGLEYPEVKEHVRSFGPWLAEKYGIAVHTTILRPKMTFAQVLTKYGYPVISKETSSKIEAKRRGARWADKFFDEHSESIYNQMRWVDICSVDFNISPVCCTVMKKGPGKAYGKETHKKAITGQMASESMLRERNWVLYGCNAFDLRIPISNPMSFWLEQDVLAYVRRENLPIPSVYGDIVCAVDPEQIRMDESFCGEKLCTTGCDRTGCVFCAFGAHLEKGEGRFERLKRIHPKLWRYCIYGGGYDPEDGLWKPTKDGLGMGHVFDVLNGLYGDGFIPYGKE